MIFSCCGGPSFIRPLLVSTSVAQIAFSAKHDRTVILAKKLLSPREACEHAGMIRRYMSKRRAALASALLMLSLAWPTANAQVRSQDYFRDVVSLSESLGKAHGIRTLCNGRGDQYWREYMQRLLDVEAPFQGGLRRSMIDGFNAGFKISSDQFNICTQTAIEGEKMYAAEGRELTTRLATANIPGADSR